MDHMGVPLLMEPNFTDYSCQVKNRKACYLVVSYRAIWVYHISLGSKWVKKKNK